ncbi:MAG: multidrug transporter [Cyanobacteria bacterium P01_F01_bin.150]
MEPDNPVSPSTPSPLSSPDPDSHAVTSPSPQASSSRRQARKWRAITSRTKHFQLKSIWPVAILGTVVVLTIVGSKAYKSLSQNPAESELEPIEAQQELLSVRVKRAEQGLAQGWVFDDGIVGPVKRRVLSFQAEGDILFVAKVNGRDLRAGDIVTKGQVLATIDSRQQESAIDTANAEVEVAIQRRNKAEALVVQAQNSLEQSKASLALVKVELARYEELFAQGVISESDRDVYLFQVGQSESSLQSAVQDVRSAEDEVREAEAQIKVAQARLQETNVKLESTQLVAPIDGVVAYINIQEGEYWNAQRLNSISEEDLIESAPIILVNPQDIKVDIEIQADEAKAVRPGQVAYVVLEEEVSAAQTAGASDQDLLEIAKDRGSRGRVFSVSPTQTPGSRGTQVNIRNFQSTRRLRLGGRAYAWIEVAANPNAVIIPLEALLPRDQDFYAFVVNEADSTVERRRVQPGGAGNLNGIEIVNGIQPGELVVTEGLNRLVDGTLVDVVNRGQIDAN